MAFLSINWAALDPGADKHVARVSFLAYRPDLGKGMTR